MIEFLSDAYIGQVIAKLTTDYTIVTGLVMAILIVIAKKTKTKLDDKAIDWLKGKLP